MNQRKKRGLQHALNDILKEQQSPILEEKSHYTAKLLSQVAPKEQKTGDYQTPVTSDQQSPVLVTIRHQSLVTNSHQYVEPEKNYTKVPNAIFDKLMPFLDPYEFKVYIRLFRLSHGFHQNQCLTAYQALSDSCGLSIRHIKRVIPALISKGLVKVIKTYQGGKNKGTLYEISPGDQSSVVPNSHQSESFSGAQQSPNKDNHDDHDDLKKNHQRKAVEVYQSLTGNKWKKTDDDAYNKIKDISLDIITEGIKTAGQRAASRPNSLNYFVKEILNLAHPSEQTKAQQKKTMEKIVANVRERNVGIPNYTFSDLVEDVKRAAARDGVPFDNDLFNQITGYR